MFTRALCAVAILLFAVSCTKDETTALPDPPQVESPLLITKRTFETTLADGQQVIDSFAYEYDDKGQIIKHTNLKLGSFVTLQYADDVVDRLTHYNGRGEKVLTQINVMKRVEDGNIFYTMGNTNPLKLEAPGFGPQIFTWTYNEEGYPLTMKTGTGFQVSYEYTKG